MISAFASGILLGALALGLVNHHLEIYCFPRLNDEYPSLVANEQILFKRHDPALPAVIFLGGSDMREAWDRDVTRAFLSKAGFSAFFFVNSSTNAIIEEYQYLSSASVDPKRDFIILNIEPLDLTNAEPPHYSQDYENPLWYLDRVRLSGDLISPVDLFRLVLDLTFPWVQHRDLYAACFLHPLPATELTSDSWYDYGSTQEPEKERNSKIAQFFLQKKDMGQHVSADGIYLKLLGALRRRFGDHLLLIETPRNPAYKARIFSPEYLTEHYSAMSAFKLYRLDTFSNLKPSDFFDGNHMHAGGRRKFTGDVLPAIVHLLQQNNGNYP